jgi:hypothetical protein
VRSKFFAGLTVILMTANGAAPVALPATPAAPPAPPRTVAAAPVPVMNSTVEPSSRSVPAYWYSGRPGC